MFLCQSSTGVEAVTENMSIYLGAGDRIMFGMFSQRAADFGIRSTRYEFEDGEIREIHAVLENPDAFEWPDAVNLGRVVRYVGSGTSVLPYGCVRQIRKPSLPPTTQVVLVLGAIILASLLAPVVVLVVEWLR